MLSQIIQGIHNLKYKPTNCIAKKSIYDVWKNIESIKGELERLGKPMGDVMRKQVNDGKSTFFGWMMEWKRKLQNNISNIILPRK